MRKKKGILGKVLLALIVLVLIGAIFGGKSKPQDKPAEVAVEPAEAAQPATAPVELSAELTAAEPVEATSEVPAEEPAATSDGEISPELREFLESYEAFVDEYCEFLETYDSSDTAAALKALSLSSKALEFSDKADAWKGQSMNDAETRYYLEVMTRIEGKLLKVSYGL